MEKAYKFRMYPQKAQEEFIQRTFGCCRFTYNHFLSERIKLYQENKVTLNYRACSSLLTELKNDLTWLREVDSIALQSSVRDLDTAYQNFFRRVKQGENPGFPRYKSKKNHRKSYKTKRVGKNIEVFDRHIKLPKLGLVECRVSRLVEGRILNATVSQTPSGKYFVSVCCTDVEIQKHIPTGKVLGIDVGLTDLAATSDDDVFQNHKYLRQSEKKLARAQRRLSRKSIGSKNREKARIKVSRIQEHIANQRNDSLHNLSTQLVRDYDTICIESLNVKGMVRNRRLAKSISDASWGEFTRQLQYKCEWHGKSLIKVDPFFPSSQLCSECGFQNAAVKDLSIRQWTCPQCSAEHNRDTNAAKNILTEGLRMASKMNPNTVGQTEINAWGESVRRTGAVLVEPRIPRL